MLGIKENMERYQQLNLFVQVDEVNSLVIELAKMNAKERALVEQCKDFLGMIAAMQVGKS